MGIHQKTGRARRTVGLLPVGGAPESWSAPLTARCEREYVVSGFSRTFGLVTLSPAGGGQIALRGVDSEAALVSWI
jgi:hypothetical protein